MNLNDLTPNITVKQIEKLYKNQFSKPLSVSNLTLKESKLVLNKTKRLIKEYKEKNNSQNTEKSSKYLRLRMIEEAVSRQIAGLVKVNLLRENTGSRKMTNNYVKALQAVARGKKLTESQIKKLKVSKGLKRILESRKRAITFMSKIVESSKKKGKLMEGEIDSAQTILAAQDIADQIQSMIEKFADIRFKELPALYDSIRNTQGVAEAESFNETVLNSLTELTSALETSKVEVNNAVARLSGQEEVQMDNELDVDGLEGDMDMDMGGDDDVDLGDEFDMDFEEEPDEEELSIGRGRR